MNKQTGIIIIFLIIALLVVYSIFGKTTSTNITTGGSTTQTHGSIAQALLALIGL